MGKKRLRWNQIPDYDRRETDVDAWSQVEIGRCGTDSILSLGYELRHRSEIEEWADEYGFEIVYR